MKIFDSILEWCLGVLACAIVFFISWWIDWRDGQILALCAAAFCAIGMLIAYLRSAQPRRASIAWGIIALACSIASSALFMGWGWTLGLLILTFTAGICLLFMFYAEANQL